jgi:hypothetical protein
VVTFLAAPGRREWVAGAEAKRLAASAERRSRLLFFVLTGIRMRDIISLRSLSVVFSCGEVLLWKTARNFSERLR